jgi:hypothetical protein
MKRVLALASVVMMMVCAGCGDSHESLAAEQVSVMKDMISTFEGIKDGPTAKSAKPTLKSLFEKMNSINERQAKLEMPTEAQGKVIIEKYGKQMEELQQKMMGSMMRIGFDPAIRAELDDLDTVMSKSMK